MNNSDLYMDMNTEVLKKIYSILRNMYPANDVNDLKAAPINVAGKILQTATTLNRIIDSHDYVTSQAVLRILADSVTAFVVVYDCDDHKEMAIRHYLYTLDGLREHKDNLKDRLNYIEQENSLALQIRKNLTKSILQSEYLIDKCCKELDLIKKNSQWGETIDVLENNAYWKFDNLNNVDNEIKQKKGTKGLRKVTWESLYGRVFDKSIRSYLASELSIYIHGMANAYISYDSSSETESLLKGMASAIMAKLSFSILHIYKDEINAICSNRNK